MLNPEETKLVQRNVHLVPNMDNFLYNHYNKNIECCFNQKDVESVSCENMGGSIGVSWTGVKAGESLKNVKSSETKIEKSIDDI